MSHFAIEPLEAIRRATSVPANVMGVGRDYGTVEPGKYADVVVVNGTRCGASTCCAIR